jgi:YebC/PmpR family DNA-binding regulatory protein
MSGHSKWSTIKHKKAALDSKRGKVFTKLIKEISVAAREGGGDPMANPRLRTLIEKTKKVNMPQDNVMRAIKKGTGELPGQTYEEQNYEGYGPGGIAVIIEVLTDNKNRAAGELRHVFSRHGGRLSEPGSVSWMFTYAGAVRVSGPGISEDRLLELLIEHPIHEIIDEQESYLVSTDPKALDQVKHVVQTAGFEIKSAELEWSPNTKLSLESEDETKALTFLEALDELEDVQNTYTNL